MDYEYRDVQVALCQPAVRMVSVEAWPGDPARGEPPFFHAIVPVLAIESRVRRAWSPPPRRPDDDYGEGGEDELRDRGWGLEQQSVRRRALVLREGHLSEHDDLWGHGDHIVVELFACPWPPEDDERQLSEQINRLGEAAVARQAHRDKARSTPCLTAPATS